MTDLQIVENFEMILAILKTMKERIDLLEKAVMNEIPRNNIV